MNTVRLRRETVRELATDELSGDELAAVAGGTTTGHTFITVTGSWVCVTDGCPPHR